MMPFLPGSFGTDGHLQALTAGTVTSNIGGLAYVGRQPKISTSADVSSDVIIGGFRVSANGLLRVTDATSALPAGTFLNGGIRVTATGRMCVAIADVGADIAIVNGVACTNDGRVYTSTVAGPVNSVLPVITGSTAGSTSSVSTGTWSGTPTYGYRWFLDGVAVEGETSSTIDTDESWSGQTLSAVVWATNDGGTGNAEAAGVVLTEGSAYTGPLDLVSGATFAYSQRAMVAGSTANAIRILEDGADTEQNFALVNNAVSVTAVNTFIGANNGFGKTWFDLSGHSYNLLGTTDLAAWDSDAGNGNPAFVMSHGGNGAIGFVASASITIAAGARTYMCVLDYTQNSDSQEIFSHAVSGGNLVRLGTTWDTSNDIWVETGDGVNSGLWIAPTELSTGRHLIEMQFAANGALVVLVDGVNVSAALDTGTQFPLIEWVGSSLLVPSFSPTSTPTEELIAWPQQDIGLPCRQNIATYYGITL